MGRYVEAMGRVTILGILPLISGATEEEIENGRHYKPVFCLRLVTLFSWLNPVCLFPFNFTQLPGPQVLSLRPLLTRSQRCNLFKRTSV
jgi:hypothetical protein